MRLESLHLYRGWGQKGVTGKVKFNNQLGEIELKINEEQCQQILAICADSLVAISKAAADEMCAKIVESTARIVEVA